MAKQRARAMAACACAFFSMQIKTSGGSSDSEVTELTVMARIPFGTGVVTTDTPLAQSLKTSLNCCPPTATAARVHHPDRARKRGGDALL